MYNVEYYKALLESAITLLAEDVKQDVVAFLKNIKGYNYCNEHVSLKNGTYTYDLYDAKMDYDATKTSKITITPTRADGGQDFLRITLRPYEDEPTTNDGEYVICVRVREAVHKMFPSFVEVSKNLDGYFIWEDSETKKSISSSSKE